MSEYERGGEGMRGVTWANEGMVIVHPSHNTHATLTFPSFSPLDEFMSTPLRYTTEGFGKD